MTEQDLARHIVRHFQDQGLEVHQEVEARRGGFRRADLVVLYPPRPSGLRLVHVVEVKRSLTFDVIAQAVDWRKRYNMAHFVSVAIPGLKRGRFGRTNDRGRFLAYQVCRAYGIGVVEVYERSGGSVDVRVEVGPRLERRADPVDILVRCVDETRTGDALYAEAGNADGRYWSPFKATCRSLRLTLAQHGPMTTRDLVTRSTHHYRTDQAARSALYTWLTEGKIPGIIPVPDSRPAAWQLDPSYQDA